MKKIVLCLLLAFPFICGFTKGKYDHVTYWRYNGDSVTLSWEPISTATQYEIEISHAETEKVVYTGRTTNTNYIFKCPKTGHYIFKVRSWNAVGSSEWAISTDPQYAKVDGVNRSFWVHSQVPPVTGITIRSMRRK